ncbi:MAG: O-antigen ligase family protein [Bacteroidales bacterium]|nr:O-antigen ligase family protein [Bacteroidales bacterium]
MSSKVAKTIALYLIAAVFITLNLYFVVRKDSNIIFAVPLVLCAAMLFVFSFEKVILLTALATPLSVNLWISQNLTISAPSELLLAGTLLIFVAKLVYERNYDLKLARHPLSIVIYIMFIWMIFTTVTSELPVVSVKYILSRLWFIIPSYFICSVLFKNPKNINKFVWLYISGLVIVVIYTIVHHAANGFSGDAAHWVMTPFYNDHTAYGAVLAIYITLSAGYLFIPNISKTRKIVILAVFGLLSSAVVLSFCRASWISLVAVAMVLACVLLKIKFKYLAMIFVILVGLFFTFQQQIFDIMQRNDQDASGNLIENIQSMTNISTDASNLERINRWNSAIRLFKERPVFGWGPGTYQFVYAPFQESRNKTIISTNSGDGGNAHSEYIGALAEMGLLGILIVISLVTTMVYTGLTTYRRARNKESRVIVLAATLALISYFVHGILNNFLDTEKLAVPVWSCMAIITAIDIYHADKENYYDAVE